MSIKSFLDAALADSNRIRSELAKEAAFTEALEEIFQALKRTINSGGTIFTCGNGGSACDASHLAEELVARYKRTRDPVKAVSFSSNSALLTCAANDFGYEAVFERQAQAFCDEKSVLFGFSTSGESENVLRACRAAKKRGSFVVAMTGHGGSITEIADCSIKVPSDRSDRIQEVHVTCVHILCEGIDQLFPEKTTDQLFRP